MKIATRSCAVSLFSSTKFQLLD